MRLTGDAEGLAALKELSQENRDYLKFLITEAQSNTDHLAQFTAKDGTRWQIVLHPATGEIEVARVKG